MTKEAKQAFTLRITQANPTQMIIILYDMFLIYCEEAKKAKEEENRVEYREDIRKIRGCLNELMNSLQFEYELAGTLLQLYVFINKRLVAADIHNTYEPIEQSIKIIAALRDAYSKVVDTDTSAAVMSNTQTVYAGLTYSKNDLNEDLSGQCTNRGFLV